MGKAQEQIMNNEIKFSIPGKIVISGEYAVLDGAPAIVSALNQRANIKIQKIDKQHNIFLTSAIDGIFPFIIDDDFNIVWLDSDPGAFGLVLQCAINILEIKFKEKFCIDVNSSEFFQTTQDGKVQKLGIGSSAAVSVGIIQALTQHYGISSSENLLKQANSIHQNLQGKQGSGIDVVCAFADQGVIECTKDSVKNHTWSILNWPHGLYLKVLTTNQGAPTKTLVANYQNARSLYSKEFKVVLEQFMEITKSLSTAWRSENVDLIIDLLSSYDGHIKKIDKIGNIGIYTKLHTNLQKTASRHNIFYKPSGAGGGDIGLAFSSSLGELNDFLNEISKVGWNIGYLE